MKGNCRKVSCPCRKSSENRVRKSMSSKLSSRRKKGAMERQSWRPYSRIYIEKSRLIWTTMSLQGSLPWEFLSNIRSKKISKICSVDLIAFCRIQRYRIIWKSRVMRSKFTSKKSASRVPASSDPPLSSWTNSLKRGAISSWLHRLINAKGLQITKFRRNWTRMQIWKMKKTGIKSRIWNRKSISSNKKSPPTKAQWKHCKRRIMNWVSRKSSWKSRISTPCSKSIGIRSMKWKWWRMIRIRTRFSPKSNKNSSKTRTRSSNASTFSSRSRLRS